MPSFTDITSYVFSLHHINTYTEFNEKDFKKREIEGIVDTGDASESVEPILEAYNGFCTDSACLWYMPYFVYLFMQYRNQIGIPALYVC